MFYKTNISDAFLIENSVYEDARGSFYEIMNSEINTNINTKDPSQIYISVSKRGVLRGAHYQINTPQSKLITCVKGSVIDFAVDLRKESPTFRNVIQYELNEQNKHSVFLPQGLAHGFLSLSEDSSIVYQIRGAYKPENERGVHYNSLDLDLPFSPIIINDRDNSWPLLRDCEVF